MIITGFLNIIAKHAPWNESVTNNLQFATLLIQSSTLTLSNGVNPQSRYFFGSAYVSLIKEMGKSSLEAMSFNIFVLYPLGSRI